MKINKFCIKQKLANKIISNTGSTPVVRRGRLKPNSRNNTNYYKILVTYFLKNPIIKIITNIKRIVCCMAINRFLNLGYSLSRLMNPVDVKLIINRG